MCLSLLAKHAKSAFDDRYSALTLASLNYFLRMPRARDNVRANAFWKCLCCRSKHKMNWLMQSTRVSKGTEGARTRAKEVGFKCLSGSRGVQVQQIWQLKDGVKDPNFATLTFGAFLQPWFCPHLPACSVKVYPPSIFGARAQILDPGSLILDH